MFKRVRLVGWVGTQLRMWPRKADDCRDPRWHTRRISGSSRLNTSLAPSSVSSSARHHPRPNPRPDSALNPRPDPSHVYCPGVEMRSERERERKGEDDGDGARDEAEGERQKKKKEKRVGNCATILAGNSGDRKLCLILLLCKNLESFLTSADSDS